MNGKHSGRAPDDPRRMDGVWPCLGPWIIRNRNYMSAYTVTTV